MNSIFLFSGLNNYLEIMKWIYKKSIQIKSPINVSLSNDKIFKNCYKKGYLDMIKWI